MQIKSAAKEAHNLRIQLLDAKNATQAAHEQAHKTLTEATAQLQDCLAARAQVGLSAMNLLCQVVLRLLINALFVKASAC